LFHAVGVIEDYHKGNPPSWSSFGTDIQNRLRDLVIDRLEKKTALLEKKSDGCTIFQTPSSEFQRLLIFQRPLSFQRC
jgi:hypothetical protein